MSTSRVTVGWPAIIIGSAGLLAAGAGIAYVAIRPAPPAFFPQSTATGAAQPTTSARPETPSSGAAADIVVTLTPEAIQRAGIVLAPVSAGRGVSTLRLPGGVGTNAHKQGGGTPPGAGRGARGLAGTRPNP